ncbi:VOC family protein [Thermostaphylospora chromogena]|uniref:VOC domain-containing protein n=1 Tax=Thermostaphylospora chromogena TaxID=35622 RepID=A0A1H1ETS4_9ACTN|nr:VOC family protein [Thermostaphylospora chromogena]SDQ92142.1 hypothetical protein SAMN04489764_2629 [Thermostaphylospora chromogena]
MVRIGSVVLHVTDCRRAAEFWTEALGYVRREGPPGESPVLVPKDGDGPTITLDETDRTHLDLYVADEAEQRAEVERLISLGAERVPWTYPEDADFVVLADPEGNLFCVVNAGRNRAVPDSGSRRDPSRHGSSAAGAEPVRMRTPALGGDAQAWTDPPSEPGGDPPTRADGV